MSEKFSTELPTLTTFKCANCGLNNWELYIQHSPDGKTHLVVSCAREKCQEDRRIALGGKEDDLIVWEEFDITGGDYDIEKDNEDTGQQLN